MQIVAKPNKIQLLKFNSSPSSRNPPITPNRVKSVVSNELLMTLLILLRLIVECLDHYHYL